jgi:hypothetical protein
VHGSAVFLGGGAVLLMSQNRLQGTESESKIYLLINGGESKSLLHSKAT